MFREQLVGNLDITGGDEQKIGYYAGFIVEFISSMCQVR